MNKFADTHIWQDSRYSWTAWNKATGLGATGETRVEAEKTFRLNWGDRGEIGWLESPPPPPRREGERPPIEAGLEQAEHLRRGHSTYRRLLGLYHPDKHRGETFTADEITAALIQLWEAK
jgi:hypothetical protein